MADDDTMVLHRIKPREIFGEIEWPVKFGLILDVETTGLDQKLDSVIQLGAIKFTFDNTGRVGWVAGRLDALIDPGRPIPPEITELTGITNEMVAGKTLDRAALADLLDGVVVVIAHHAKFDRPFAERLDPQFKELAWACSLEQLPWKASGIRSASLEFIAFKYGLFYDAHRAFDDVTAVLDILSRPFPGTGGAETGLQVLLTTARTPMIRIWALSSPFGAKDDLKARGYSWNDGNNGKPKSWSRDIPADDEVAETKWLYDEIYGCPVELRVDRLRVYDRFSERE